MYWWRCLPCGYNGNLLLQGSRGMLTAQVTASHEPKHKIFKREPLPPACLVCTAEVNVHPFMHMLSRTAEHIRATDAKLMPRAPKQQTQALPLS